MGEGEAAAVSAESRALGSYGDCRSNGGVVGGQEFDLRGIGIRQIAGQKPALQTFLPNDFGADAAVSEDFQKQGVG